MEVNEIITDGLIGDGKRLGERKWMEVNRILVDGLMDGGKRHWVKKCG